MSENPYRGKGVTAVAAGQLRVVSTRRSWCSFWCGGSLGNFRFLVIRQGRGRPCYDGYCQVAGDIDVALEILLLTLEEFRKTTPQSALRRFVSADECYRNRHFQQNVGMPPAKFRKSVF